jgi:diaminopimelate decarboxylase
VGKQTDPISESWNIFGSLCSMNDILAKQVPLPEVVIGDTICFENTGAYCMTEGISLFLSRDIPAVYLIREDGTRVCVRKSFETAALNTPKTIN